MKILGILLIVVGLLGLVAGMNMFGDIGISAIIGSVIGILSGVGFFRMKKVINKIIKQNEKTASD